MVDNGAPAVRVVGLTKRFRLRQGWVRTLRHPVNVPRVTALNSVSVEVGQGECFGLLGQNGAGKTTLFKVLATLIHPDEGSAMVLGVDTVSDGAQVRRHIAPVIANERSLYWRLSARENLRLFAALYALDRFDEQRCIDEVLDTVGLGRRVNTIFEYVDMNVAQYYFATRDSRYQLMGRSSVQGLRPAMKRIYLTAIR